MELERRNVCIFFCWKRAKSPSNFAHEINSTLRAQTTNERTCRRRISQFKGGDFDVDDKERKGCPSSYLDNDVTQKCVDNQGGYFEHLN